MRFTGCTVEAAALEWLGGLNYLVLHGPAERGAYNIAGESALGAIRPSSYYVAAYQ